MENIRHSTLFHFAGHGISNGGFGALLLAPGPGNKAPARRLTADEIRHLNLKELQLLVLAACSSGAGEQAGAVNLDSLVRSFLEAGAVRVVAARWNVSSNETADTLAQFYEGVLQGERPAEALRQAALAVRNNPFTSHPYFWASFQIFGTP
jgi:CHAT domain-containing protein